MSERQDHDHDVATDEPLSPWGTRFRRRVPGPPRRAIVASVLLHVAVVGGLLVAGVTLSAAEPDFKTYKVRIKSPPPQVAGEPAPVTTTTPVTAPDPAPPPPPAEAPKPTPKPPPPKTQSPEQKPVDRTPDPKPAQGVDPKPVEIGGENIDIDIAGADFPYPEYLEKISLALIRYFRPPPGANLEAEVIFFIRRDGSVGGVARKRRSASFEFDLQALQAVEAAGKANAFGPLPDGLQGDRLWIAFTFTPTK